MPDQADLVLVVKSERKLYLMKGGHVLRAIDVALGLFPKGPKRRAGDFRTPEGNYRLEGRNANSDYFSRSRFPTLRRRSRAGAQVARRSGWADHDSWMAERAAL